MGTSGGLMPSAKQNNLYPASNGCGALSLRFSASLQLIPTRRPRGPRAHRIRLLLTTRMGRKEQFTCGAIRTRAIPIALIQHSNLARPFLSEGFDQGGTQRLVCLQGPAKRLPTVEG